ncbi:MAG: TetR/AcrR family transcriptional regulator [Spirochaetales bacterium]|nr:TetR/AcrR family transcriptional regulator [Spirochaetales bacterium]
MGRDRVISDAMQLVRTAFKIIDEEGYEHFSARKLAVTLGVSHMTVYNYMERDELLNQVIIMGFSFLNEKITPFAEQCRNNQRDACTIFSHISSELLEFAKNHPNMYRFMFQSKLGLASDDARVRGMYSSGVELIKDVIPPERYKKIRDDAYLFFVLINGLVLGYLGQRHSTTDEECKANMARAYDLLLASNCASESTAE